MSIKTFVETVKSDIFTWVDDAEHFVEAEAAVVWTDIKPIALAVEPAVYGQIKGVILAVLTAAPGVTDLATLEAAVLNALEAAEAGLLAIAKALGSNILQALIAVVRAA